MAEQQRRKLELLDLPEEVLDLIMRHATARGPATTYPPPQPSGCSYDDATFSWARTHSWPAPPAEQSLVALASTCRKLRHLSKPLYWRAPNISTIVSANRLADAIRSSAGSSEAPCKFIRHLHIPNDGLLLGKKDVLAERVHWSASLRTILSSCTNLQTIFLATMPGGDALTNFLSPDIEARPKRITFSCLSSAEPSFHKVPLQAACGATHLHFIQSLPFGFFPALIGYFYQRNGPISSPSSLSNSNFEELLAQEQPRHHPLEVIRFSRLNYNILDTFADNMAHRLASARGVSSSPESDSNEGFSPAEVDALLQSLKPLLSTSNMSASMRSSNENESRRLVESRRSLCDLASFLPRYFPHLKLVLIELGQLAELSMPEHLEPLSSSLAPSTRRDRNGTSTSGVGAPFDELAAGTAGALQTVDFPSDVALSASEIEAWRANEEEVRCKGRDDYWDAVRRGKEALELCLNSRRLGRGEADERVEVRVVAARLGGWDRNESLVDFFANTEACSHSSLQHVDKSAFNDPDIFDLAERDEKEHEAPLGYNYAEVPGTEKRVPYWTGILPRSARRRRQIM